MNKPPQGGDALPQTLAELQTLMKQHLEALEQLTPLLQALLQQLRSAPAAEDRRSAPRFAARRVQVSITGSSERPAPFVGRIINYSTTGLALVVDTVVPVGTVLTLKLPEPSASGRSLEAEVKHRQEEGKRWRLGCQLLRPVTLEELGEFGLEES